MNSIILPIHPKYSQKILSGEKKFEYRRVVAKNVSEIYIYETSPTMKIVGVAKINKTIREEIPYLWELTKNYSGVNRGDFLRYFKGREYGFAYEIKSVQKFDTPLLLTQIGIKYPPQSHMYVNEIKRSIFDTTIR